MKNITITDKSYTEWISQLSQRYRNSQIKAAVKVNREMLKFYWSLGRDIVKYYLDNKYGSQFYSVLSSDLRRELPDVSGLSERNIRYMKDFYLLYSQEKAILPQLVAKSGEANLPQLVADSEEALENSWLAILFQVPWGHHRLIMDKVNGDRNKALFFVNKTIKEGWSRDMLLNFLSTNLYEREGKAITNFKDTLPEPMSDLANEITKDPYNFAFAGIRGRYNEKVLKDALLRNITEFLVELGTGFAYVGKEYRLQIGEKEKFIDLLFFHIPLNCYVVIEVKIGEFDFPDAGQLNGYVVACNHILKQPHHNPTIGLLICKGKDNLLAKYALEGSNQPIGISEYDLEKLYPTAVEGMIPSIEEIETKLANLENNNQK